MARRFFLAFVFTVLYLSPDVQSYLLVYSISMIFFYHLALRPYKGFLLLFLSTLNEGFLITVAYLLWFFIWDNLFIDAAGWVLVGVLGLMFVVNWSIIVPIKIYELIHTCKQKMAKKKNPTFPKNDKNEAERQKLGKESPRQDAWADKYQNNNDDLSEFTTQGKLNPDQNSN